jgi:phosphoribosyl 1,2-cyclic phosphodiesterase
MSLELCILGSGSGGNSTVVRAPWGTFLIDAGFGPRSTAERMGADGGIGLQVNDISAVVLTHLDHDHFNRNWFQTILKMGIRIFCSHDRRDEIVACPEGLEAEEKLRAKRFAGPGLQQLVVGFKHSFEPVKGVKIESFELAHDDTGSHGFVMACDGYRVGFATDLGRVPDELIERFCGVDVLALESNYDPKMERESSRPFYLKQRIMGGNGHLSNEQALAAVLAILDRTEAQHGPERLPRHIVLLHRSRQCNCPRLVRKLFAKDSRIAQVLTLTHQEERTPWLSARSTRARILEQLTMAWR